MKKIITENQEDFKLYKGMFKSQNGKEIPVFYLKGNTRKLNTAQPLYGKNNPYGAMWDGEKQMIRFWQDRKNPRITIDTKIKPLIDKINEFYKYTLQIDDLVNSLEEYIPTAPSAPQKGNDDKNKPVQATAQEAMEVQNRLNDFKERILKIESSEELQNVMRLMMDVKNGKSYDFSPNNKLAIKAQRPDATIVCSPNNWKAWYNRTVNQGAKPIFVRTTSSGGYLSNVTSDFLRSVGKSSIKDLTGSEQARLHKAQNSAKYNQTNGQYPWMAFYDVKDTTQIPGTQDEISMDIEKAKAAAEKLGDTNLDSLGSAETTNETEKIKPIYEGLLAYAKAQNFGINKQGGDTNAPVINAPSNVTAASTKLLANAILSQILNGTYLKNKNGVASKVSIDPDKVSADAKTPQAQKQQAEIASWQFMEAFGITYRLSDIDMSSIFGVALNNPNATDAIKDQKKRYSNINEVLKIIEGAVNHLIDFVNVQIEDNAKLTEDDMGMLPHGKHVSASQIGRELGIPSDMLKETDIQSLQERLIKKVLKRK
jgi:hypothetical protein